MQRLTFIIFVPDGLDQKKKNLFLEELKNCACGTSPLFSVLAKGLVRVNNETYFTIELVRLYLNLFYEGKGKEKKKKKKEKKK